MFHSMVEGVDLFHRLDRLPVEALCLMPDHVHLVAPRDVRRRLAALLSGWARRCNARRQERGALVGQLPDGVPLVDRQKQLRAIRYVHLNPSRAGLVQDPLAWPLSTHRDAVGLTGRRVGPARRAEWFHRYVSGDPSVDPLGSPLPREGMGKASLEQVLAAVSAVTRTPVERLRGPQTRSLAVAAAAELTDASVTRVASALGCGRTVMYEVRAVPGEDVARVARVIGDPRFGPVGSEDLRRSAAWEHYLWGIR